MSISTSPSLPPAFPDFASFLDFVQTSTDEPLNSVALELEALQSIYGEDVFRLHEPPAQTEGSSSQRREAELRNRPLVWEGTSEAEAGWRVRYEALLP